MREKERLENFVLGEGEQLEMVVEEEEEDELES